MAFDERFSVPLDPAALEENSLRFSVFGVDEDERSVSTGVAELKLSDLELATRPFNAWLYLQDTNKVSQQCPVPQPGCGTWLCPDCGVPQAVDTVGEILLSLSYLPTAERLTVVVVKAKNLVWSNGKVTAGEGGSKVGFVLIYPVCYMGVAPCEDRPAGKGHQKGPPCFLHMAGDTWD